MFSKGVVPISQLYFLATQNKICFPWKLRTENFLVFFVRQVQPTHTLQYNGSYNLYLTLPLTILTYTSNIPKFILTVVNDSATDQVCISWCHSDLDG